MNPVAFQIGSISIRWYAICILCGAVLAFFIARHSCKKQSIETEHLVNLTLLCMVGGIIGARLYYVIFRWPYYSAHPGQIVQTWHGGLAIHGGLLAGLLVIWLYSRYQKQSLRRWLDILAPGVILAQAIGRWGNFFNQEAYGYETSLPWAMYIDGAYRHPTFLYESLWDLAGFALLLLLSRRRKGKPGDLAAVYFIWYSCGRCVIEYFRTDSLLLAGRWKAAMLISLIGVLAGVFLLILDRRHPAAGLSCMQQPPRSRSAKKTKAAQTGKKH